MAKRHPRREDQQRYIVDEFELSSSMYSDSSDEYEQRSLPSRFDQLVVHFIKSSRKCVINLRLLEGKRVLRLRDDLWRKENVAGTRANGLSHGSGNLLILWITGILTQWFGKVIIDT